MPACLGTSQFVRHGNLYRCRPFDGFDWLEHGFSTRSNVPLVPVITLKQVHSADVRKATGLADRTAEGDALISNAAGTFVGVRTADCVPILLADPNTKAVAAVHAGWRGTAAGIARKTVEELSAQFGSNPASIHAAFGPAIRVCCYEVGEEVSTHFRKLFPEWSAAANDGNKRMLDLIEANRRILIAAGVPDGHIYDSGLCTFCCASEFYSFRREPNDPGRMASYIGRKH